MAIYSEELIEYLHNGNIERAIKYADAYSVLLRYLSISYSDRKDNVYLLDEKLKSANISPDINRWFTDHIEVTHNGDYVNIRLRALLYGASISKDGLMTVRMIAIKEALDDEYYYLYLTFNRGIGLCFLDKKVRRKDALGFNEGGEAYDWVCNAKNTNIKLNPKYIRNDHPDAKYVSTKNVFIDSINLWYDDNTTDKNLYVDSIVYYKLEGD